MGGVSRVTTGTPVAFRGGQEKRTIESAPVTEGLIKEMVTRGGSLRDLLVQDEVA
jgi:hypothetical protein